MEIQELDLEHTQLALDVVYDLMHTLTGGKKPIELFCELNSHLFALNHENTLGPWRSMESAPRDGTGILLDSGIAVYWGEFHKLSGRKAWVVRGSYYNQYGELPTVEKSKGWLPLPMTKPR